MSFRLSVGKGIVKAKLDHINWCFMIRIMTRRNSPAFQYAYGMYGYLYGFRIFCIPFRFAYMRISRTVVIYIYMRILGPWISWIDYNGFRVINNVRCGELIFLPTSFHPLHVRAPRLPQVMKSSLFRNESFFRTLKDRVDSALLFMRRCCLLARKKAWILNIIMLCVYVLRYRLGLSESS